MRLGGLAFPEEKTPESWASYHVRNQYRAAYWPLPPETDEQTVRDYMDAASKAGLIIAEVGAWSNPLSPDPAVRSQAIDHCIRSLEIADRVGARCCVNIAGSRGGKWDGPHPDDLTEETFGLIVETVRHILDAVRPIRSYYTLETMPWMYPDSVESYLRLIRAIDRQSFAVHLDPVNLVCSPQRYFSNSGLITECIAKLGPWIRSCHAKDILLHPHLTTHLDEIMPGKGGLDYGAYLRGLNSLDPDTPLMIEHLQTEEEYMEASRHIRDVAQSEGISI